MAPDNFKNLGLVFKEDQEKSPEQAANPTQGTDKKD